MADSQTKENTGFLTVQDSEASDEIRESLKIFGSDVLSTKFPSCFDGLKDITRRIVWHIREYKSLENFTKLMGEILVYHISGDSSVYEALVRLGQPFMMGHPLVTIQGNLGKYSDPKSAAHPRYLEAQLSEFAHDIFIKGIHPRTLPMAPSKTFGAMEPRYLIPKLPAALFFGNLTVGFGFKSHFPMYDFKDVCDLTMMYADFYASGGIGIPPHRKIAPYVVPNFPIPNLIRNRTEIIKAAAHGIYDTPAEIEGWVDISGNAIVLRAVPYGIDFGTVTGQLREQLQDKKHWLWNHVISVQQFSTDVAELHIEVKRGRNPFEVLELMKRVLKYQIQWRPIFSYLRDGRVVSLTPANLVYLWYQERAISIAGGLKYRQAELISKKMVLKALLIISDHTDEVINLIKKSEDEDSAIDALYARFKELTWKQAKIIAQQKISTLAKASRRQILSDLEQTEEDLQNILDSFGKIHETIHNDAAYLKKKYGATSETKFSEDFMGYVQFGNQGIAHFFDEDGMRDLLMAGGWGNIPKKIHIYSRQETNRFIVKSGKLLPMEKCSKEIACEDVICYSSSSLDWIWVHTADGYVALVNQRYQGPKDNFDIVPITEEYWAINKDGSVTKEKATNQVQRKSISKGGKSTQIWAIPNTESDLVVLHISVIDPNQLRVDRILVNPKDAGCLKVVGCSETVILDIVKANTKTLYLNIPSHCKKNIAVEQLKIEGLDTWVQTHEHSIINLNKTTDKEYRIRRDQAARTFYSLEL